MGLCRRYSRHSYLDHRTYPHGKNRPQGETLELIVYAEEMVLRLASY